MVGTDAFIRTLDWRGIAEREYELLDPESKRYYDAYADGVNAYLAERSGAGLSLEYAVLGLQNAGYAPEPWTPIDSIAWLKAMAWDLRSNLGDEIDRALLATTLAPEQVDFLHPEYAWGEMPTILGGPIASAPAATSTRPLATGEGTSTADSAGAGDAGDAGASSGGAAEALTSLSATIDAIPELLGPEGGDLGSNSWVISGALTESGQPLLANEIGRAHV